MYSVTASLFAAYFLAAGPGSPDSASFSYQGQLTHDGRPYDGPCDLKFTLCESVDSCTVGVPDENLNVEIENGLFSVELNDSNQFGVDAFNGDPDRYLKVEVRCPADMEEPMEPYELLTPNQRVTAASTENGCRGRECPRLLRPQNPTASLILANLDKISNTPCKARPDWRFYDHSGSLSSGERNFRVSNTWNGHL